MSSQTAGGAVSPNSTSVWRRRRSGRKEGRKKSRKSEDEGKEQDDEEQHEEEEETLCIYSQTADGGVEDAQRRHNENDVNFLHICC